MAQAALRIFANETTHHPFSIVLIVRVLEALPTRSRGFHWALWKLCEGSLTALLKTVVIRRRQKPPCSRKLCPTVPFSPNASKWLQTCIHPDEYSEFWVLAARPSCDLASGPMVGTQTENNQVSYHWPDYQWEDLLMPLLSNWIFIIHP